MKRYLALVLVLSFLAVNNVYADQSALSGAPSFGDLATHETDTSTHGATDVADVADLAVDGNLSAAAQAAITASHAESHDIPSHSDVTDATGAQLETLTGSGDADALHTHTLKANLAGPTFTGTVTVPSTNFTVGATTFSEVQLGDLTDTGDTTLHDHDGISENTTHRTSDGTNHTYIDQDVTSGADATFGNITTDGIDDNATATAFTIDASNDAHVANDVYFANDVYIQETGDVATDLIMDANRSGAGSSIARFASKWNGTTVAQFLVASGSDTTNKDDGEIRLMTTPSGGSLTNALVLDSNQQSSFGGNITIQHVSAPQITLLDTTANTDTTIYTGNAGFLILAADVNAEGNSTFIRLDVDGTTGLEIKDDQVLYAAPTAVHDIAGDDNETALYIDPDDGEMGYISSVRASKINIKDMPDTYWLYELKPRIFNRRVKVDGEYTDDFTDNVEYGLIAEEVKEVAPDDMTFSVGGNLAGVSLQKLVPVLINELQRLHAEIELLKKK